MKAKEITLRDYYAGLAMQIEYASTADPDLDLNNVAKFSFELADAMLAERNKEQDHENE